MPREISLLALRQLAEWEKIAVAWPVYTSEYGFIRCAYDDLTVWRTHDDHGQGYTISGAEILALRVAHLRNHHPNLDPCKDIS
jgi:hypothetical protein